jgi:hypothetical protein
MASFFGTISLPEAAFLPFQVGLLLFPARFHPDGSCSQQDNQ